MCSTSCSAVSAATAPNTTTTRSGRSGSSTHDRACPASLFGAKLIRGRAGETPGPRRGVSRRPLRSRHEGGARPEFALAVALVTAALVAQEPVEDPLVAGG